MPASSRREDNDASLVTSPCSHRSWEGSNFGYGWNRQSSEPLYESSGLSLSADDGTSKGQLAPQELGVNLGVLVLGSKAFQIQTSASSQAFSFLRLSSSHENCRDRA
ncbi:hypothetical protein R1flu_015824 [Riccia fluitans]|uniref:Uncharacterized protein n=1 Tax=Riccia fluitans TaxID=41844 RepID=A0ABD1YK93_9MARC